VAYFVQQQSAHLNPNVNVLAVVFEPVPLTRKYRGTGAASSVHVPPLPLTTALRSIILRI